MVKAIFKLVKNFLAKPAKAYKAETGTKLKDSFKYAFVGLLFLGVLSGLILMIIPLATMPIAGHMSL